MFQMVSCNLTVLAIAIIYYAWRDGYLPRKHNNATLRDRVSYMLWVAAHRTA